MRDSVEGPRDADEKPSASAAEQTAALQEVIRCDEKPEDLLEEPKTVPKDALEDSPEVAPAIRIPKAKEEANGDVFETFLFPCQHCERKFTTKQGLERHMHIHISTVNHAFKCKYCGKAFGTQINRRRHERRHEAGLKRKPSLTLRPPEAPADGQAPGDAAPPKDDAQPPGLGQDSLTLNSEKASQDTVTSSVAEENGEVKELHPCQYCKKVFGTHTNMRRHQRRVHERHLIPKGVRRKGGLLEEQQPPAEQAAPAQSVYVPSTEPEEEGEADDVYIMDISSNISENLNYYIDGKIQTSCSTSNCDVIEMESSSADLYGINCLLAPVTVEITQNIKTTQVPVTDDLPKEPSSSTHSEPKKRRTASPPVLPRIKAETESEPVAPSCSLSLPLSMSTTEAVSFHKEKNVYLSSKLKQLLQTQDKLTPPAGISATEIPKLGPVCVSTPASMLPVTSSRFKRRTSSPPSSPQHSPALRDFGKPGDGKAMWTEAVLSSKKPKLESHSNSPAWSLSGRDERETGSPPGFDEYKVSKEWAASSTFSNVCNQQPLDLSSGVKQKAEGTGKAPVQWESVLDLSVHKKPSSDSEGKEFKENHLVQPACSAVKKKKPTTCMLQKVLLNEYNGIDLPVENAPDLICPSWRVFSFVTCPADIFPFFRAAAASLDPNQSLFPPTLSSCVNCCHPTPSTASYCTSSSPRFRGIPSSVSLSTLECHRTVPTSNSFPNGVSLAISHSFRGAPYVCCFTGASDTLVIFLLLFFAFILFFRLLLFSFATSSLSGIEELENEGLKAREESQSATARDIVQETFNKNFVCNVCESPFLSIKDLTKHLSIHAEEWPFKCEFCVQLFKAKTDLSEHRFLLHGVGNIFVCSVCKKEFAFLCNLQQHQRDLHPDKAHVEHMQSLPEDPLETSKEEEELNDSSEELYTTIKIMASGIKTKDPDVRLGLNQHYPSFKPPPFQYHHRNPLGIGVTATNFTTHNIPQTFTTAIRCTKCGKGVDNMPELHRHILACASASDKKRYTPKKNPVPLKQTVQPRNGVVVLDNSGKNAFRRMGQPKRLNFSVELSKMSSNKLKLNALKKKNQLVQKAILQKNKSAKQKADLKNAPESSSHICPYCNREFTYIGSLNKHAAFSCPKKPLSPSKKKAPLGKTRARSSGPAQVPPPSSSFRSKQNVKFAASVKSKKPSSSLRNSSPIRMAKMTHNESKKPRAAAKNHAAQLSGKTCRSLHVRAQKSRAVLQSKSASASRKRTDRFNVKSRERSGGPITRSLQLAAAADPSENRREDGSGKQELKDF
ncbi:hypothetical protein E2I00_000419, partial [Balaenoptera physalus]